MAVAQRLDRRLDDEFRRAEIGLADAEIDDVAAGRLQLHGARQHGKRILLADAIEGGNSAKHGSFSRAFGRCRPQPREFSRSSRENQIAWGVSTRSVGIAEFRPKVALHHRADKGIGILAEIVALKINWTAGR